MAVCSGDAEDHCCWLGGERCEFLADVHPSTGRRYLCSLRFRLGSWERVHLDPRYLDRVRPKLDEIGIAADCGDWPTKGERCSTCGVVG